MGTLGELERAVMDALWDASSHLTSTELRDALKKSESKRAPKELAVTTVLTVLSRLEKKGFVTRDRGARPHRYRTVSPRADYTAELMHEALGGAHDREAVLSRFVGRVSQDEAEALQRLLSNR
jgi:BlaI family transcriptional regulator, penicillinase repressor